MVLPSPIAEINVSSGLSRKRGHDVFSRRLKEWIAREGLPENGSTVVGHDDKWLILSGVVDSPATKAKIISMVPVIEGGRWIVDRLFIVMTDGQEDADVQCNEQAGP